MEFIDFVFLATIGLFATIYKVLISSRELNARFIVAETFLSLIISIAVIPAFMESYAFSIVQARLWVAIVTISSSQLILIWEKFLIKKGKQYE